MARLYTIRRTGGVGDPTNAELRHSSMWISRCPDDSFLMFRPHTGQKSLSDGGDCGTGGCKACGASSVVATAAAALSPASPPPTNQFLQVPVPWLEVPVVVSGCPGLASGGDSSSSGCASALSRLASASSHSLSPTTQPSQVRWGTCGDSRKICDGGDTT